MLTWLEKLNGILNGIVWGPPFIILLVGTGLYLTIRLGGFQFTHLGLAWRETIGRLIKRQKSNEAGAITSFQAVASAMAGTIGVGNIAGVATALAIGGPGAIFWMWMVALVGMATKFCEAYLGHKYRDIDDKGRVSGGVFYFIEKGLGPKWKPLAMTYALLAGLAVFGIGNMVQANTVAASLENSFQIDPLISGVVTACLVAAVTLGGISRIGKTAEVLVPFMAITYLIGALIILVLNVTAIPAAFGLIFQHAFAPAPATGGFAGAAVMLAIRMGVARGIFSNEAGLGSASIVYAQSKETSFRQGLWGLWEVFIDTIVICTVTALVIIVTGVWDSGANGGVLAQSAFNEGLGGMGKYFIPVALSFFSFTTLLTWNFYGEKSWEYLTGGKKTVLQAYRVLFILFIPVGAIGGLELVWDVADTLNGMMAAPNLIALIILAGVVVKAVKAEGLK
jgi:AGCS family alanine or glycine:cation symporter